MTTLRKLAFRSGWTRCILLLVCASCITSTVCLILLRFAASRKMPSQIFLILSLLSTDDNLKFHSTTTFERMKQLNLPGKRLPLQRSHVEQSCLCDTVSLNFKLRSSHMRAGMSQNHARLHTTRKANCSCRTSRTGAGKALLDTHNHKESKLIFRLMGPRQLP